VGRGKRCAAGVHTYLKSKAKGKQQDEDLRGEARRRPARSDKIAASQRARVPACCGNRTLDVALQSPPQSSVQAAIDSSRIDFISGFPEALARQTF
jgi:hypothetical protein